MATPRERLLAAKAQISDLLLENAEYEHANAVAKNEMLAAENQALKQKTIGTDNYRAMIRRRAKALAAKGEQYNAILLLRSIGE